MSTYSYQDLDSRLRTVEDKLDFMMKLGSVTKRSPGHTLGPNGEPTFIIEKKSMLDLYHELQAKGQTLEPVKEVLDGTAN